MRDKLGITIGFYSGETKLSIKRFGVVGSGLDSKDLLVLGITAACMEKA